MYSYFLRSEEIFGHGTKCQFRLVYKNKSIIDAEFEALGKLT